MVLSAVGNLDSRQAWSKPNLFTCTYGVCRFVNIVSGKDDFFLGSSRQGHAFTDDCSTEVFSRSCQFGNISWNSCLHPSSRFAQDDANRAINNGMGVVCTVCRSSFFKSPHASKRICPQRRDFPPSLS